MYKKKTKLWACFDFEEHKKVNTSRYFSGFFFGQNFTTFKLYFRTTSTSLFILKIKSVEFILFLLYEFIHVHSNEIYRCIFLLNAKWNCKIRSFPMWATLKGNSFLRRCKFMIIYMMIEVHRFPNVNTLFPNWKCLR